MLEDVKRIAESAQRTRVKLCGYSHFRLPFPLKSLRSAAASRRTKILFHSNGMSKRELNWTFYNNRCFKETVTTTAENPIKQLIKLNCLLRNLAQACQFSDCLHLFQQIHSSHHLKPDQYTVSTTLTSCANLHDTTVGCQLHAHSIRSGLTVFPHVTNTLLSLYAKSHDLVSVKRVFGEIKKPDVYSHTTLLSACVKLGEVDYAIRMFDQISHENVPVWNAMITGCAENGHAEIAFDLFHKMHMLGIKADNYTYASILSLCSLEQSDIGIQVHSVVVKTGFLASASVTNSLITMYFNCKSPTSAYGLFEEVSHQVNEITYNAIIAGFASMERDEEALLMFKDMKTVGLKPTELTFVSVMGACLCSRVAIQIHCQAIMMGLEDFTSVNNAAISMYSHCGDLNAACLVFRGLGKKDIVSWNAIIASYARENLGTDAVFTYLLMQRNSIEPDEFTFGSLLASSELLAVVEMIQAVIIKKAFILKTEVSNSLLSAFSRHSEIDQASKLFCDMYSRNLVSWNAMIFGFWHNGLPSQGLQQIFEFLQSGLRPNHCTLSLVLSICGCISDLQHGKQVHAYILKFGYFSYTLLGNALITFYAKVGALIWSSRVFHSVVKKDIVSWNSMISAYAQHGEGKEAIHCFEDMRYSGEIRSDKATFTAVLSACSHSGLVAEGIQIFNLIVNAYGIEPDLSHFSCIVDLLGRAGLLDIAGSLINRKGINIDSSVWWTLFSSCAAHGHIQLGSIVAGFLLETESDDPAAYVLLSNLYANAGKWEESANLRELMKKVGVIKQPGSSWIGA